MLVYFKDEDELGEMDPIEAEVDAIRQKLWEEIKDMPPEEASNLIMRRTEGIVKQFHMKTSKLKPAELVYTPRVYEDYASL